MFEYIPILDPNERMYYYSAVFFIFIYLLWKSRNDIADSIDGITKKDILHLAFVSLLGLVIRLSSTRFQGILEVSVWQYRLAAIHISESHQIAHYLNPKMYSLLISPLYSLTKDIVFSAHIFDIILGTLSIPMIAFLTYALFRDKTAALISSIILAFLPWHIFFSATHGVEITASFFIMLIMIILKTAGSRKRTRLYFIASIGIIFVSLIKKEQIMLFLVLIICAFYQYRGSMGSMKTIPLSPPLIMAKLRRYIPYVFVIIALVIPYAVDTASANIDDNPIMASRISGNFVDISKLLMYNYPPVMLLLLGLPICLIRRKYKQESRKHSKTAKLDAKIDAKPVSIPENDSNSSSSFSYSDSSDSLNSLILLAIWLSVTFIPFLMSRLVHARYFIFFIIPIIVISSRLISLSFRSGNRAILAAIFAFFLLSSIHIGLSCLSCNSIALAMDSAIDSDCKYIRPVGLRWADSSLFEIKDIVYPDRSGINQMPVIIFLSDYTYDAWIALFRGYSANKVYAAHDIIELNNTDMQGVLHPFYDALANDTPVYAVEFTDFWGEDEISDMLMFYRFLDSYSHTVHYAGEGYKIYRITDKNER